MERELPDSIFVRPSLEADVTHIANLIDLVPEALVPVEVEEIERWIKEGRSLVAVDRETGTIVAHQGLGHWTLSDENEATELRSAYTHPHWRKMGINTVLKKAMIERSQELYPNVPVVGFTEEASKSRGILKELGFVLVDLHNVPEVFFSICPQDCAMKNGHPCGCKVFVDKPELFNNTTTTIYKSEE